MDKEMNNKQTADEKEIKVESEKETAEAANNKDDQAAKNKDGEQTAEEKLATAEEEIAKLKDKYLRTAAEFDNYRKRTLKEKAELLLNGSEKTVCAVLPILDDFERALANTTDDAKAMKDGMQIIFNKFNKVLESLGVKKIETDNQDFNVDYHEAVAMVPGMGDDKKGKVIDCVQSGYQLNDKVIRHAKVAVGQ